MSPALRLHGVQVRAAQRLLLDVPALEIGVGERVAVVGPNGAGKSTLLRVVGALLAADEGQVQVLGRSIGPEPVMADGVQPLRTAAQRRALRRETGLLLQGLHLVPRLSARENVLIGALPRLHGWAALRSWWRAYPAALEAEAAQALALLGLGDRADTRADRLSGGERQKVALARLLLQRPRLVLADEPTSALDPAATAQVVQCLNTLTAAPGCTLISVVHDTELLPALAQRVIGMAEGRVCWDLPMGAVTPARLEALYAPASPSTDERPAPSAPRTAFIPAATCP